MRHRRAWTMPVEEARTFLQEIQQKIVSWEIEVAHRDVLIRLQSIIEETWRPRASSEGSVTLQSRQRRTTTRAGISDVRVCGPRSDKAWEQASEMLVREEKGRNGSPL